MPRARASPGQVPSGLRTTMVGYVAFPSMRPSGRRDPAARRKDTPRQSRLTELGWASTHIGEISPRRRLEPTTKTEVYEVKLGDEYLMSSMFTVAEEELARL